MLIIVIQCAFSLTNRKRGYQSLARVIFSTVYFDSTITKQKNLSKNAIVPGGFFASLDLL